MMCEIPLTPEQKIFAAQNHDLVYKFLQKRNLPAEDFYDIVVFGYLRSICRCFSEPEHRYTFGTVAWREMYCALIDYKKACCCQKRSAEILSLHSESDDGDSTLEETLIASNDLMTQLEIDLILHDLAKRVSEQQMEIVRMKSHGYNLQDIATHQNTSTKRIRKLLKEVRSVLTELCYE